MAHYSDDNNQDIAHFLEKLNAQNSSQSDAFFSESSEVHSPSYDRSFEKLENKIQELEKRFETSSAQNKLILSELAHTRSELNRQKSRDAFLEHISRTIASLKNSVENLSRARQQSYGFYDGPSSSGRTFDPVQSVDPIAEEELRAERIKHAQELAEKERVFSSLRQKASQLKAVNSALDREIKKVQQEKLDALKKSAEQAKEILSLRDQLTAAEERFKSFNFEGRIISIKRQYEQKVSRLESQLKEISNTCMKQVEEIEALKAENLQLQTATKERDELQVRLQETEAQVGQLQAEIALLRKSTSAKAQEELASFQDKLHTLQSQRDHIAAELEQAKLSLENMRQEKDTLENNFKALVAKINGNDQVISELKQKIEVLSAQNETLAQTNKELSDRNGELSAQTGELGHQNESLLAANRKLLDRNSALTNQNQALSSKNEELSGQNASLASQNQALSSKNEELSGQNASLVSQNKTLSSKNEELSGQNTNLASQNQALSSKNEELSGQNANLASQNQTLSSKNESLSTQNEELTLRNTQLTRQTATLSQTAQQLGAEKVKLASHISKLNQEKHALEKEKQTLAEKNRDLSSQSAALVAAHLQQRNAPSLEKETPAPQEVAVPLVPKEKTAQTTAQAAAPAAKQPVKPLPEIKVNEPRPPLFEQNEDFLEKTNTFIGRMRWSVFGEDK